MPKPEERLSLVKQMHEDLGHFGEQRTLAKIRRRYFWHSRTTDVKAMVRGCQQCQLVRSLGSIRSGDEQLKSIPVCDLFHGVALDTAGPLPETRSGNKYIMVAIDHYSKWCEAKAVADHGAKIAARFLEDDLICRYGVPNLLIMGGNGVQNLKPCAEITPYTISAHGATVASVQWYGRANDQDTQTRYHRSSY